MVAATNTATSTRDPGDHPEPGFEAAGRVAQRAECEGRDGGHRVADPELHARERGGFARAAGGRDGERYRKREERAERQADDYDPAPRGAIADRRREPDGTRHESGCGEREVRAHPDHASAEERDEQHPRDCDHVEHRDECAGTALAPAALDECVGEPRVQAEEAERLEAEHEGRRPGEAAAPRQVVDGLHRHGVSEGVAREPNPGRHRQRACESERSERPAPAVRGECERHRQSGPERRADVEPEHEHARAECRALCEALLHHHRQQHAHHAGADSEYESERDHRRKSGRERA